MDKSLEDLQIKLAYLEESYEVLNQAMIALQSENTEIKQQLEALRNYVKNQADLGLMKQSEEPLPPHY